MSVLKRIAAKLTKSKFERNDWRIIEAIPAQQFEAIIDTYREQGWEFSDAYRSFDPGLEKWRCKLRKGTSTLRCEWRAKQQGRIYGPSRPMNGLGQSFDVSVRETPSQA